MTGKADFRYRANSVHTVLSQPAGTPTSDAALGDCVHSLPSRKARTSSPPRLVDQRLLKVSRPSSVAGGDAPGCPMDPGGGSIGRPCVGAAALIGGRDCEYDAGGGCDREFSHEFIGCRRADEAGVEVFGSPPYALEGAREGSVGEELLYCEPSG